MKLVGPLITPAASGGAGAATGSYTTTSPVEGYVMAVYVKYEDSPPVTTDVTVATLGTAPYAPAITVLAVANGNTDGWRYPYVIAHLNTDGSTIANTNGWGVPIADYVKVTVAQANDNDYVKVWLLVDGD